MSWAHGYVCFVATPKPLTLIRWLVLLPIPLLWCLASYWGGLGFLENKLVDFRFRARGEIPAPIKVVYVDIDSESVTDLGNMPWDRSYFAEVSEALLREGGAKAIGLDVVFSEKGKFELVDERRFAEGNERLRNFLFADPPPPLVVAAGYASAEDRDINGQTLVRRLPRVRHPAGEATPPELPEFRAGGHGELLANPPHIGLIDTIDGGTRWVPLFAQAGGIRYSHMSLELARLYWGVPPDGVSVFPDRIEMRLGDGSLKASIPMTDGQDVEVNWFSHWSSPRHNPRASFVDALVYARALHSASADERKVAREFFAGFKDAVVLIGPADPLLQDIAPTPLDSRPVPRVGIHGNLLKTIVSGEYLRRPSFGWEMVIVLTLTVVVLALAVGAGRGRAWTRGAAVLVAGGYVALAFVVFVRGHWVVPIAAPLGAALSTSFVAVGWQLVREERQKGRIKSMFGTYVSPELVDRMVDSGEDPKLGGAEVQITAYFSDIQEFSTFSEQLTPPQIVELMNEYLTACTNLITAEGGTLDKYIGDAVVAMFGAPVDLPDHAHRACLVALRIQTRLAELRRAWAASGRWPESVGRMRTRIGLNTGEAVVGNMGSNTRFNYTMMGDSVNLAARLESAAKLYGATTLVTEATKQACELRGNECVFRFLDRIVVKGRSQPVGIYELVGLRTELPRQTRECVEAFETGIAAYLRQDWAAASASFRAAAEREPAAVLYPGATTPAQVYLERCDVMKANPPAPDWNGVWVMRTK